MPLSVSEKDYLFFLLGSSMYISAQSSSKTNYKFGAKLGGSSCNITSSRVKNSWKGWIELWCSAPIKDE